MNQSSFADLEITELERAAGIAPQLLAICKQRAAKCMAALTQPGTSLLETELLRGRLGELNPLIDALQDARVGSLSVVAQTPKSFTEPKRS